MLYYFLPAILALGIITSYEDIKYGKIRNKWVVLALIYGFVVYAALVVFLFLNNALDTAYLIGLGINIALSLLIGFGMWYSSLWSAGDAKLFLAYSALVPLPSYNIGYIKYFPSITLLINTFVPVLFFFLVFLLFKATIKQKKETLKAIFEPKSLFNSLISLITIFWLIRLFFSFIGLGNNAFLSMVFSLLSYFLLNKIFPKKLAIIMALILIVRLFIDESIYSFGFVKNAFSLFMLWILARGLIFELGFKLFTKDINISELREGVVPAEAIFKEKNEYKKVKWNSGFISMENKDYLYEKTPEGLTKKEIKKILTLYKDKKLKFKTIKAEQMVPFAPFMFLGVLLTLLAKGNILIVVKNLFL